MEEVQKDRGSCILGGNVLKLFFAYQNLNMSI
jgi:hypothetical protein